MKELRSLALGFLVLLVLPATWVLAVDIPKDPKAALDLARNEKRAAVTKLNKARQGGPDEVKYSKAAMKHLETAQKAFAYYLDSVGEDEKVEEEMSELQSLLYWTRKMTPLREDDDDDEPPPPEPKEDDQGKPSPPPPPPRSPLEGWRPGDPIPEPTPERPRAEIAKELYGDAERFAQLFPDLLLQIVAQFFRVADAYRDTPWGLRALEKAIEYQKRLIEKEKTSGTASSPSTKRPERPTGPVVEDPTLLRLQLRDRDRAKRTASIDSLVHSIGSEAVLDLHEMFLSEMDEEVRKTVFKHLVALKDKRTLKQFRRWWATRERIVADDFIRLVGAIGNDKNFKYAVFTVVNNVQRLTPPTTQRIIDSSGSHLNSYVSSVQSAYGAGLRYTLSDTASKMGDKGGKGLTNMFKSRSGAVREAILCLGAMGDVKSGKYVVIYLAQYKAGVYRGEAMAALKMMGDDVIPYLIKSLARPKLKMWCAWLLRNMTGQHYSGGNPAKWWAWYRANRRR